MKYSLPTRIQEMKIILLILPLVIFISILLNALDIQTQSVYIENRKWIILPLFVGLLIYVLIDNTLTPVWTNTNGIIIQFAFLKLAIPWSSVTGLFHLKITEHSYLWIITVKTGLTPFHYFYPLLYLHKFSKGFCVVNYKAPAEQLFTEIFDHTGLSVIEC